MTKIAVALRTGDVEFHITCSHCHVKLEVTHQANDIGENWIEIKPHTCKE